MRLIDVVADEREPDDAREDTTIKGGVGDGIRGDDGRPLIVLGIISCSADDRGAGSSTSPSDCVDTYVAAETNDLFLEDVAPGGGSGFRILLLADVN